MASLKLLLNKSRMLQDGTFPLVFQLIHRRRKKLVYTPYRLYESEFDVERGRVVFVSSSVRNRKQVSEINRTLRTMEKQILACSVRLAREQGVFTVDDIVQAYRMADNGLDLMAYFELLEQRKQAQNKLGMAAALHSTRMSLSLFVAGKSVCLSAVDTAFVLAYEEFLKGRGLSRNTVCYYMRNFRAVYNRARYEGFAAGGDPFVHMRMAPCRTMKRLCVVCCRRIFRTLPRWRWLGIYFCSVFMPEGCLLSMWFICAKVISREVSLRMPNVKPGSVCRWLCCHSWNNWSRSMIIRPSMFFRLFPVLRKPTSISPIEKRSGGPIII